MCMSSARGGGEVMRARGLSAACDELAQRDDASARAGPRDLGRRTRPCGSGLGTAFRRSSPCRSRISRPAPVPARLVVAGWIWLWRRLDFSRVRESHFCVSADAGSNAMGVFRAAQLRRSLTLESEFFDD